MHNDTLVILHILTYYEFLRILLFSEIWIVIKKVGVGNLVIFCLFEYNIYIYISIRYIYIYIYIYRRTGRKISVIVFETRLLKRAARLERSFLAI